MADQNPTLVTLYQSLCAQQDAISKAIQDATDPTLATTLSTENFEIMHRIVLVQNLLFQSDSAELRKGVKAVTKAAGQLQEALEDISSASDIVNNVSQFLGLVDEAIDLAKTLAPLAA
jgi:hypothetical protein